VNGLVAEPQPVAVARAMDRLHEDREACRVMGCRARERVDELGIGWPRVLERLLA
jgi:hypothetical protein